jgi:two-component system, OmpR family, phosphate regulon sensor histidine kinase PhoR
MEKLRVLVVDDEAPIRDAIAQILTMEGHEVETAADGKTARALMEKSFHVAFIDYKLPDTDGLNLLALLREKHPPTATCMITAYANFETAVAATRQGADIFLPKPFSTEELLASLVALANSNRYRREAEKLKQENEFNLKVLAQERSKTRTIIECLRDGVLVVNREGLVVYYNRQTLQLLRLQEEQIFERKIEEVFTGTPFRDLNQALRTGPPKTRKVFEVSENEKALLAEILSYLDPHGEPLGTVVVLRDITQEKQNNQVKTAFVRMMVHELRAPVSTLMSFLAVLKDHLLGNDISAYHDAIQRMSNRVNTLAQLIGDLLEMMRIDAAEAKAGIQAVPLDLGRVVREQLNYFAPQIAEKKLLVKEDLPSSLVVADPDDIQRILANLISNAIKYNREGGEIICRTKRVNDMVELDITDTGYGIRGENQEKIFTEFFREKKSETNRVIGSGLGLSIVHRLCQRNSGRVRFVSEHSVGSTFTIALPSVSSDQ